jgi:hypothetical protein
MTTARQQLGKHVPEVMLSTIEACPKARNSEVRIDVHCWATACCHGLLDNTFVATELTHIYTTGGHRITRTVEGSVLYSVHTEVRV